MPRLTEPEKMRAITLLQNGWSLQAVADDLHVCKNSIFKLKEKWNAEGHVRYVHGGGRRKVSTVEEDNLFLDHLRRNPFDTAVTASFETNFPGSVRTARKRVKDSELKNYVAANKVALTPRHKEQRLEFARQFVGRPDNFWENVIFSDEKSFQSCSDGSVRVYRPENTRYSEPYVKPTERSGRFSINVWAWISCQGPGVCWRMEERLTGLSYVRIMENVMLPSVTMLYPQNFTFQQDNCSIHTSRVASQWFIDNNINVLPWPSKSPDLNPIENAWGYLVKKICDRNFRPANAEELWEAIENAWDNITEDYTRTLILSMPRRLQSVIDKNGAWTKY